MFDFNKIRRRVYFESLIFWVKIRPYVVLVSCALIVFGWIIPFLLFVNLHSDAQGEYEFIFLKSILMMPRLYNFLSLWKKTIYPRVTNPSDFSVLEHIKATFTDMKSLQKMSSVGLEEMRGRADFLMTVLRIINSLISIWEAFSRLSDN